MQDTEHWNDDRKEEAVVMEPMSRDHMVTERIRREDLPEHPMKVDGIDWDTPVVDLSLPLGTVEDMTCTYFQYTVNNFPKE